ncbi:MAG: hypothetical protein KAI81_02930 [Candidatus Marinimicrobia bacterium]|nr:hypothetical protein [Candidatus Neomarinimicrobiota bacterium]
MSSKKWMVFRAHLKNILVNETTRKWDIYYIGSVAKKILIPNKRLFEIQLLFVGRWYEQ